MRSLQNYSGAKLLVEKANDILDFNYKVFPYEWEKFKKFVLKTKKIKQILHPDDPNKEYLYDPKNRDILIHYDKENLKAWTSIEKADFFRSIRGEENLIDKYLK